MTIEKTGGFGKFAMDPLGQCNKKLTFIETGERTMIQIKRLIIREEGDFIHHHQQENIIVKSTTRARDHHRRRGFRIRFISNTSQLEKRRTISPSPEKVFEAAEALKLAGQMGTGLMGSGLVWAGHARLVFETADSGNNLITTATSGQQRYHQDTRRKKKVGALDHHILHCLSLELGIEVLEVDRDVSDLGQAVSDLITINNIHISFKVSPFYYVLLRCSPRRSSPSNKRISDSGGDGQLVDDNDRAKSEKIKIFRWEKMRRRDDLVSIGLEAETIEVQIKGFINFVLRMAVLLNSAMASATPNVDLFDAYFRCADLDRDDHISGAEAISFF
ncbi:hypothetical protein V8G54_022661 [Vigna mungo]|uniref:EF-hand domain-containing protein n=1 Tax=Vigna mungo TaxID=3915 RepID=A0AAQ3N3D7_VIGMU